jgi:hypothetical protein
MLLRVHQQREEEGPRAGIFVTHQRKGGKRRGKKNDHEIMAPQVGQLGAASVTQGSSVSRRVSRDSPSAHPAREVVGVKAAMCGKVISL